MERDDLAYDGDTLRWLLQQSGVSPDQFAAQSPDFLVISPPKTGSTWLAENLRCHPEIFVPEIKEIRYFSSWFKWLDLNWYLNHLAGGVGRIKGEASPSYAPLPVERIRLIRRLMPRVKLIFLMRDPVGRAWSHARHNYRYREANFASCADEFAAVSDDRWAENFAHDWPLANGDYLGQLRRWLAVFPREQVFVGFYESIAREPETLLRSILNFLGVRTEVNLDGFPLRERILPGLGGELTPALRENLRTLLANRTRELAAFLGERFGLTVPPEWDVNRDRVPESSPTPAAFARADDDRFLAAVVAQEESDFTGCRPVVLDYRGFAIVLCRGQLHAIDHAPEPVRLEQLNEDALGRYQKERICFTAPSLTGVKECVDQCRYSHFQAMRGEYLARITELQAEVRSARCAEQAWVGNLEHAIRTTAAAVRNLEAEASRKRAGGARRIIRSAWRRIQALCGMKAQPVAAPRT